MSLRSPREHENADLRRRGMDCRHPGSQDASGDIHVSLDSSGTCWNDDARRAFNDRVPRVAYFRRRR
jgi:hypothetical protein